MYGMVDTDEAADDLGDIMSILFEYVAPMVQSEAVVAEDKVEFGHMPPNTYNDASAEERVWEKDRPAARKFAPKFGSLDDMERCDHIPFWLSPFRMKRHNSDPPAPLVQSPDSTVMSPSSSARGMKASEVEVDRKGSPEDIVENVAFEVLTVSEMFKWTRSNWEDEGWGEKMYAAVPFCETSIRVGLYGNSAAVAAAMSARRLAGRWCRFRRIMPFVVRPYHPGGIRMEAL
jgi:hypothetical protein